MNMESVVEVKPNPNIPEITSGDTVKVSCKIVEGDKERIQVFQGVVIRIRRRGISSSFTVRRVAYGVGVERTFPFYSPRVEKVELVRRGKKRRAKLYYLRGLSAKTARLRERRMTQQELEREQERIRKIEEEKAHLKAEQQAEEEPVIEAEQEPVIEEETVSEQEIVAEVEPVTVEETGEEPAEEVAEEPVAETETEPLDETVTESEDEPETVSEVAEEPVMEQEEVVEAVAEEEETPEQEEKKE
ncbi:MAG: 50S ribosomal protein L19 [Dehalococcoidales bacterium]|nr:MAG: 50S ribosomal protein L19 [Dehalococcoidales bacterium]